MDIEKLFERMNEILVGIDTTETDSPDGWWETSTGANFGFKKRLYLYQSVEEWWQEYLEDKVVLPKEPTKELIEAMESEIRVQHGIIYGFTHAYRAMLKDQSND